jgi:hypothetical protein
MHKFNCSFFLKKEKKRKENQRKKDVKKKNKLEIV